MTPSLPKTAINSRLNPIHQPGASTYVHGPQSKARHSGEGSFRTSASRKAASKTRMQHATYLYEIIEWAVSNGVIEELMQDKQEDIAG